MAKRTTVGVAHSDADLGRPAEHSREQLDLVKGMIRDIADQTMGGMKNIVKAGDKVLIKINTVIPVPADAGFTTDPRMLEALIELVAEQNPSRIQIGERCAMGGDTANAMEVCGIGAVARRTGAELCPFDNVPFDMYKIDRPIAFNEFPVPRPVVEADCYIGLPKMKVHLHTTFTGAMKLQFGNLPDYDWMVRCHRDDIYQKIVNLTRAANPKWFVMDSLVCLPGKWSVQRIQRRPDQGLQYHLRRSRSGCGGYHLRSLDGLAGSGHQCCFDGAGRGRRARHESYGRDRTRGRADRQGQAPLPAAEYGSHGSVPER